MSTILSITDLRKSYAGGFEALKGVNLEIAEGEILALLGPNALEKRLLFQQSAGSPPRPPALSLWAGTVSNGSIARRGR